MLKNVINSKTSRAGSMRVTYYYDVTLSQPTLPFLCVTTNT